MDAAFRILGVNSSATKDEVKKAYKEKLKYFHPDRYQENEILQKVATNKTRQIVSSYEKIMKEFFFEK
jgi:DnaJ like chaperone protein